MKLMLIDGHSMAFRAFFALPVDKFSGVGGQPTNAVYGFVSMLINLLRDEQPTHLAVAFDVGRRTFRTDEYEAYKGTRDETPEPFKGQVPLIQEVLGALNVIWLTKDNFEADDIMATLAAQGDAAGMDVVVCSGDRDALQLVTEHVTVLYPRKGVSDLARMTPEAVEEKYGVPPRRYPDLAALVGETSDNLPGVPGVGPKTAAKWINAYDGLDGVLARADEITGKAGESLRANLDQVRLNRRLNALLTDIDLPVGPLDLAVQPWDREAVHALFDTLQFRTLRERLFLLAPLEGDETSDGTALEVELDPLTDGGLGAWLQARTGTLGLDVTGAVSPLGGDAWTVTVASEDGHAVLVDLAEAGSEDDAALGAWLADAAAPKAVHASKRVGHMLAPRGLALAGVVFDPELAGYLAHPDQRSYTLEGLAERYLGVTLQVAASASEQGALDLDLGDGDDRVAREAATRALATLRLVAPLTEELTDRGELELLTSLELPLGVLLGKVEEVGIAVDPDELRALEQEYSHHVTTAADAAFEVIGREVNLGSPKQLQEVLFDQLDMPKTKKIKSGYTTDAAALLDLFAKTSHPFLEHLLAHRDATRLRQTVEGLLRSVADDGRIHTTFQQTVAATGRLSSVDPNLQNIPIRTEAGRRIRRGFVVGEGYETLLTADYSQIEMRIMAHLSGDAGLIDAFRSGEDLHSYVGARVFGVETTAVTGEMRSRIKAMSYGLAYGLSPFGLSKQLGISTGEASALMTDYFQRFGGVRDYLAGVVEEARSVGYTATILGRRRYLPDLTSDNRQRREIAERMALNSPIQGSAADIIKLAMLGVGRALEEQGLRSRLLLQIHDELLLEVAPGEREQVEALVRAEMGGAATLDVPLDVSVGVGPDWQTAGH